MHNTIKILQYTCKLLVLGWLVVQLCYIYDIIILTNKNYFYINLFVLFIYLSTMWNIERFSFTLIDVSPLIITLVICFLPDFVIEMGIWFGIMVLRSRIIVCLWDSYRGQVQKKWSTSSVTWTLHKQFLYSTMLQLYRCWFRPDIFMRIQARCMELTPQPIEYSLLFTNARLDFSFCLKLWRDGAFLVFIWRLFHRHMAGRTFWKTVVWF